MAALAAERRTDEQMERLEELTSALSDEAADFRRAASDYHQAILAAAHSPVLGQISAQVWDFEEHVWSTLSSDADTASTDQVELDRGHERVTEAIRLKDPNLARLHMTVWLVGGLSRNRVTSHGSTAHRLSAAPQR